MNDISIHKTNINMDLQKPLHNLGISKIVNLRLTKYWLDKDMDIHLWILIQP
jgi:hypothetical protein